MKTKWENLAKHHGGQGFKLPHPVPFNPGPRPICVGFHLSVLFQFRNHCEILRMVRNFFSHFSHFPPLSFHASRAPSVPLLKTMGDRGFKLPHPVPFNPPQQLFQFRNHCEILRMVRNFFIFLPSPAPFFSRLPCTFRPLFSWVPSLCPASHARGNCLKVPSDVLLVVWGFSSVLVVGIQYYTREQSALNDRWTLRSNVQSANE